MASAATRRLPALHHQLTAAPAPVPPVAATSAAGEDALLLLGDADVKKFIMRGWHILQGPQLGLDPSVHERNYREGLSFISDAQGSREGLRGGHPLIAENMTARAPSLRDVCACPAVAGALESLLGQGYALHPHTFLHATNPGADQQFHKDGILPWNGHAMRAHQPEYILMLCA